MEQLRAMRSRWEDWRATNLTTVTPTSRPEGCVKKHLSGEPPFGRCTIQACRAQDIRELAPERAVCFYT